MALCSAAIMPEPHDCSEILLLYFYYNCLIRCSYHAGWAEEGLQDQGCLTVKRHKY